MSFNEFKSQLGIGARPNQFRCLLGRAGAKPFLVKAASLPGKNIGQIDVPVYGKQLRIPGDVTYDAWSVTVLNDEQFTIRNQLEAWVKTLEDGNLEEDDLLVQQLDKSGAVIKSITLIGAFPTTLGAVELSYDSSDTISEFTCDFAYQRWE